MEQATLEAMLKSGGTSLQNASLINVNFQLVSSLMSKQVDAVIGGYRNYEANELREKGVTPIMFKFEDYGVPRYDELIYLANTEDVKDSKIKKFPVAVKNGTDYLIAHPDDSWTKVIKAYPDLNTSLNKTAWSEVLPKFSRAPASFSPERYAEYGKFLLDHKVITKVLPVNEYAVDVTK